MPRKLKSTASDALKSFVSCFKFKSFVFCLKSIFQEQSNSFKTSKKRIDCDHLRIITINYYHSL